MTNNYIAAAVVGLPAMSLITSEANGTVEVCVDVVNGTLGTNVDITLRTTDTNSSGISSNSVLSTGQHS